MKKTKLLLSAALAATLCLWTGCREEQSEFDFDALTESVTLEGLVYYHTGVDTTGTDYTIDIRKPAAGRKVFVEIDYSQFSSHPHNGNQGKKIYEAVVDTAGHFSLTVPTKSTGIEAELRLEEFTAYYTEYLKTEAGQPVFKTTLRQYSRDSRTLSDLKPGTRSFTGADAIYYESEEVDLTGFTEKITLKGNIQLAVETGYRQGTFRSANQAAVEFNIGYEDAGDDTAQEVRNFTFSTTTDANGNYSIDIPARSLREGFRVIGITVQGIGNAAFKHWTSPTESGNVAGLYKSESLTTNSAALVQNIVANVPYELGTAYLFFTPNNRLSSQTTSAPDPINWEDNLAGWAFGMDGFKDMAGRATVTGNIQLATETAYATGAYTTAVQGFSFYYNGELLHAATNADGSFSVELPVEDPNEDPGISLNLEDQTHAYTHYTKTGTKTLRGMYKNGNKTHIENAETDWTDMGTYYCLFTPDDQPDTWNADLAGWVKIQDYDLTATASGKAMLAYESAYGIGAYKEAENEVVSVSVSYGSPIGTKTLKVPVQADGTFTVEVPVKDENDRPTVTWTPANITDVNDFVHYTDANTTKTLSGTYTASNDMREWIVHNKREWGDLGTQYYTFAPTMPAPATWHQNLIGWAKIKDNNTGLMYTNSVTVSGKAMFAKETGFATGNYAAAAGEIIALTADGKSYNVLVGSNGTITANIPAQHAISQFSVTATGNVTVDDFVHYVNQSGTIRKQTLTGTYHATTIKETGAEWNDLGTLYYKFTPGSNAGEIDWNANLAGWAVAKDHNAKATITGQMLLPRETGFWAGEYVAAANQVVTITSNGFTLQGPTDAEGNFSIDVPLQFADDESSVTWSNAEIKTDKIGEFTHYRTPAGATQLLEGTYTVKETKKPDGAKWNQLGVRYYQFSPSTSTKNWPTNTIAGWQIPQKTRYTVTGSVKKAIERYSGGSVSATWAADAQRLLTVTVNGTRFDIASNNSGTFSLPVQLDADNAPDNITVTIAPKNDESTAEIAFTHYPNSTENKSTTIYGYYTSASNISYKSIAKPTTGSTYAVETSAKMKFNPTKPSTNPDGWSNYDWSNVDVEE